jgi:hypothetical protein
LKEDLVVEIGIQPSPFVADPPYAPAFYEALGRVIVIWGRLEQNLTLFLQEALNIARLQGIDEQMQVSLTGKTNLIKKIFGRCSVLADRRDDVATLMNDIVTASDDRNLLIHSSVSGFIDGDPPRLLLQNIKYKNDKILIRSIRPSMVEINEFGESICGIHSRLVVFTWNLGIIKQQGR